MATYVFPAIRAHIGTTDYYTVTMTARELSAIARPANELKEWTQWSISERIQRDVSVNRVSNELIPYLLESRDRFFGSLILIAYQTERFEFEPIDITGAHIAAAYNKPASRMGFLTVTDGRMVALDGQHRLVSLREIINGHCNSTPDKIQSVAEDEICVVFLNFESLEKTRRIFNKVNRHAKPTTPHDNIITSEDDGYAIVARWLTEDEPPIGLSTPKPPLAIYNRQGEPLVEWKHSSLTGNMEKITTLNAVYQTVEVICDAHGIPKLDEKRHVNRPDNAALAEAYTCSALWWNLVLNELEPLAQACRNPFRIPAMREYRARDSLLFRPIAHIALFEALGICFEHTMDLEVAVKRMNRINWQASADIWRDVIIRTNGQMIAKKDAIRLAARLIAYLVAADLMTDGQINNLRSTYRYARGLPPDRAGGIDDLPKPVQ